MVQTTGDVKVFYILIPLFIAVGLYLVVYGRRRAAMLSRFARDSGLRHQSKDVGQVLEETLNNDLRIDEIGKGRAFSLIRDIVSGDGIALFRCVEALDLSAYSNPYNIHGHRICVTFSIDNKPLDTVPTMLLRNRDGRYTDLLSGNATASGEAIRRNLEKTVASDSPKHTLSITLSRGRVLIYFLPTVEGSEKIEDVKYLFELAKELKQGWVD